MSGYWWLPDNPTKTIPGILHYSPNDIHLDLIGSFTDLSQFQKQLEYPIILGFTTTGTPVTLYKCFTVRFSMSHPSLPTSSYRALHSFIGMHFPTEADIKFNRVYAHLTHFDEWMGVSGFSVDLDSMDKNKISISYSQPPEIRFELNEKFSISIWFGYSMNVQSMDEKQQGMIQRIALNIEAKSELQFQEFQNILSDIRQFLGLACLNPIYPLEVKGLTQINEQKVNEQTIQPTVSIYFLPFNMPTKIKEIPAMHMLFTYRDIGKDIGNYFKKWIENKSILEPIYNLYSDILHHNEMAIEHRFLFLIHALEAYHRRTSDETEVDEENHAIRISEILTAIPKHSDWLQIKLQFSNELSLRQRLESLLNQFPFILENFDLDNKKFIRSIVDMRNYITHYSNKAKTQFDDLKKVHEICERLKLLVESCLLFQLGFDDKKISLLIERSKINKGLKRPS
ncbi:ApeA N-terminal domain 1-containing protein [Nitrosotalea sinensis]|nr:HEPN domain-containing protein [Candidatus Nitrosotalea sinensis]